MCKYLVLGLLAFLPKISAGEVFLTPSVEITQLAIDLGYKDFPTASDILTIARNESSFRQWAKNKISNGVMQVNNGSFNIKENMIAGVKLLREYYVRTRSKEAAIMAYNIGIGNYLNKVHMVSGAQYLSKYRKRKNEYARYVKEFSLLSSCYRCSSYAFLHFNGLCKHSRSYFLAPYRCSSKNLHSRRCVFGS